MRGIIRLGRAGRESPLGRPRELREVREEPGLAPGWLERVYLPEDRLFRCS